MTWSRQERHKAGRYPIVHREREVDRFGEPFGFGAEPGRLERPPGGFFPIPAVTPEEDEAMDALPHEDRG